MRGSAKAGSTSPEMPRQTIGPARLRRYVLDMSHTASPGDPYGFERIERMEINARGGVFLPKKRRAATGARQSRWVWLKTPVKEA